ncbi:MAG TPA: AAA family ATPase, partial [Bdellovibrionota bacterium]|nr:AAA family ATPase [Bdellovibrionota bacterium]
MKVSEINRHLAAGDIDVDAILPHLAEYNTKSIPLPFEFGLKELPTEPGIISVRGPRQYGKSTWLESCIADTIEEYGPGSAFYLNGDEVATQEELLKIIAELVPSFSKKTKVKRLFIDEITAVTDWEIALKRAADQRIIKNILVVTTGSKAFDIRRGHERLPGRKGKLAKTDYIFLPCSYRAFYTNVYREFRGDSWKYYLLTGGSPFAANEIYHTEIMPEFVRQITRDWILGEIVMSGRNRTMLTNIMRCIVKFGGTPVGYAKLARESGLANNTVASGYIEQLADLMCVIPSWQFDQDRKIPILRKPCKFPMINLSAAMSFHPNAPRSIWDFDQLGDKDLGIFFEWAVAQELWRRRILKGLELSEELMFWKSEKHELDFIDENGDFVEVKSGPASPLEFNWFPKV